MIFSKKKFYKDISGNSLAYFVKNDYPVLKRDKDNLIKCSLEKKKDIRICFHKDKKSKLHIMLNSLSKKKFYNPHLHKTKDEFYNIISGKLKILIVNKKNEILKKIILSKNQKFFFLRNNLLHYTIPLTTDCTFIEARCGPYDKNDTIFYKNLKKLK